MALLRPIASILLAGSMLAACGFHLRGSGGDKTYAQNLFVDGPGRAGSFYGNFANALTGAGGQVAAQAATSNGVLYLYRASYFRQPITLSRTGLATGYDLSYRVIYEVRGPKGEVLQPRKEFEVKRDYFNNQTLPLAQLAEESQIREELEKEAAQTLLRKVSILLRRVSDTALVPEKKL